MKKSVLLVLSLVLVIAVSGCVGQGETAKQSVPKCESNWQCSDWSDCSRTGTASGVQSRTCNDMNNCSSTVDKPSESQACILSAIVTKEPSEMVLNLSDFSFTGQNYTLKERTERVRADVSNEAREMGWQKGYYVLYARIGDNLLDATVVKQLISIYPAENISKIFLLPYTSNENITYNELSKPNIGDDSKAYRVDTKDEWGNAQRYYEIKFIKTNVLVYLLMAGTTTDYELLKDLARKAESKIG